MFHIPGHMGYVENAPGAVHNLRTQRNLQIHCTFDILYIGYLDDSNN